MDTPPANLSLRASPKHWLREVIPRIVARCCEAKSTHVAFSEKLLASEQQYPWTFPIFPYWNSRKLWSISFQTGPLSQLPSPAQWLQASASIESAHQLGQPELELRLGPRGEVTDGFDESDGFCWVYQSDKLELLIITCRIL